MSTLQFTTFSKLFKKTDCAVRALAVLSTIPDLAEASELRINPILDGVFGYPILDGEGGQKSPNTLTLNRNKIMKRNLA